MILGPEILQKDLRSHSMVQVGENIYIICGHSSAESGFQTKIQKLTCVSGVCSWTILSQQLKLGRNSAVAIPVMDSFCTPNWESKGQWIKKIQGQIISENPRRMANRKKYWDFGITRQYIPNGCFNTYEVKVNRDIFKC